MTSKIKLRRLAAACLALVASHALAQEDHMTAAIDWPTFLARNNMVWSNLPTSWSNAPFIGNGDLGTIFWQTKDGDFHFEISRASLYDHRKIIDAYHGELFSRNRLPNGWFSIKFGDAKPTGQMQLDLWNAEVTGDLQSGGDTWKIRTLAEAKYDVIAIEVASPSSAKVPVLTWHPEDAKSTRTIKPPADLKAYPPQEQHNVGDIHVSVQQMPADIAYHTDGLPAGQYATAWKTVSTGNGKQVILLTTQLSYPGTTAAQTAVEKIRAAEQAGLTGIEQSQRDYWHAFYTKSFLSVPDASIERFYWAQMYKMASAARAGGPIIDLMGPWFDKTTWPAIWWNLNAQLTYWPFYMSNHLEEATTLSDTLWNGRAMLAKNAAPYEADSYAIGRATGPDCSRVVGAEIGNLPWVMHNLWMQYRSSMDDAFLREKVFPLMKGSFRYLRHIAVERPGGKLALPAAASPEYIDSVDDCTYALANFRWLATTLIEADARLKANDPIVADCQDVLKRLIDYPIDEKTGVMVGKDTPFTHSHRHWSHLFMIYPFQEWDWADPAKRPLMEKSVHNWASMQKGFAGFSWVAAASMAAGAGDSDQALDYLHTLLRRSMLPNTLYREGSPVIETPLAGARSVQELVLDSHGSVIRVFPGVPKSWGDVSLADFRAEGAFMVSAQRTAGKTEWIKLTSLAGEPCRIRCDLQGPITTTPAGVAVKTNADGTLDIPLAKGQTITLHAAGSAETPISAVKWTVTSDPWGSKKGLPTAETP